MIKIFDLHNDFLTNESVKSKKAYIKKINQNKNIEKLCAVIWTSKMQNPLEQIVKLYNKFLKNNKKLVLCIEDLSFVNKNNLENVVDTIIKLQPLYCSLTWNFDNELGGGAFGKKGLTRLGKIIVKIFEKNNIYIDTAHMNRKTFYDFCKITTKPILCSHANINSIYKHNRNLTDTQISTIIQKKGLIGISFVKNFISDSQITSQDIKSQFSYLMSKYICDNNIGIGSDFFGTDNLPLDVKNYNEINNIFINQKYFTHKMKKNILSLNAKRFFKLK